MTDRRLITADELIRRLEQDPAYRAREALRNEEIAQCESHDLEVSAPILIELRAAGAQASSVWDIVNQKQLTTPEVAEVLLRWLPAMRGEWRVLEALVRGLAAAITPFDGAPLAELFDHLKEENRRWVVANTLESSAATGVTDWLRRRLDDPTLDYSGDRLLLALAKRLPAPEALAAARKHFARLPHEAARIMGKLGGSQDLPVLEAERSKCPKYLVKAYDRAIRAIERRQR